jgi:hypothetical protein
MKARQIEVFNEYGDLERVEITLEDGTHLFDAVWDDQDEQTEENRIAFREWVKRMVLQKEHTLT